MGQHGPMDIKRQSNPSFKEIKKKEIQTLYGCLFRQVRLERGYSLEAVAQAIGVSKGTMWEAEQGIRKFSLAALKKGMYFMNASYQETFQKNIPEIIALIQRFITACYFYDINEQEAVYQEFLTYHFDRHQTFDDRYYYLLTLEVLIDLQAEDPTLHASIFQGQSYLEKAFPSFPEELKEVYYYVQVAWLEYNGQLMAIESYVNNLFSMTSREVFRHLHGLVGYFLIRSTIHNCHLSHTYRLIGLLREIFQKDMNYIRMIFLDNLEGIFWVMLEEYDAALERFKAILHNVERFQLSSPRISVYNSILWCYLMKEDYEQVLEEADRIEERFGCAHEGRNLIFSIYANYRLGQLAQAKARYRKMKDALSDSKERDQFLLEAFHALLFKSKADFEMKCEEIVSHLILEDRLQAELAHFLLKALLYEHECQNHDKEAYFLRKRIAKVIKI